MLKIPLTLRRSKESTSVDEEEEALIVTPRGGGGVRTNTTTPRSGGGEALAKWEQKLGAEGGEVAQPLQSPRGPLVSPRWVDDHAGPHVQKNRSDAQVGAMAALYATNPLTFES